jgi:hypothetical protein
LSGNRLNKMEEMVETQDDPVVEAAIPEIEPVANKEKKENIAVPVKGSWREIIDRISYKGIVKNMPYLMFLTVLCILYITNNNRAISLTRSINDKSKELKELRWKYMDIQSRLMYQTSETQMINRSAALGLKPLDRPSFEVKVKVPAAKEN